MLSLPLRTKFRAPEWHIASVPLSAGAALTARYHYARGGAANAMFLHGLFLNGDPTCYGIAWWLIAPKASVDKYNPGGWATTLSLHRLVIHPAVPTNGASFLLGRSIRAIAERRKYGLLVTYADMWRGHKGQIYKATNWDYRGLTNPLPVWLDAAGRQRSTTNGQFGQRKVGLSAAELRAMGCTLVGRYPKHVYTMALDADPQLKQLNLWEKTS